MEPIKRAEPNPIRAPSSRLPRAFALETEKIDVTKTAAIKYFISLSLRYTTIINP
jgi:hypothetical protein